MIGNEQTKAQGAGTGLLGIINSIGGLYIESQKIERDEERRYQPISTGNSTEQAPTVVDKTQRPLISAKMWYEKPIGILGAAFGALTLIIVLIKNLK